MSEERGGDPSDLFMQQLEETGFFRQMGELEGNLRAIAGDLQTLGVTATQRLQETESLAAHLLALESLLVVLMRRQMPARDEVLAVVRDRTADPDHHPDGNPAVVGVVDELIARAESG